MFEQETLKPGKMQASDSEARKPGTEFSWLHGFLLKIMSCRAGAKSRYRM